MRVFLPLLALLLLVPLLPGPALAWDDPDYLEADGIQLPAQAPWQVVSIQFKGFQAVTPAQARAVMEYKSPAGAILPQAVPYDALKVQRDLRRLEQLFHQEGYFRAQVKVQEERQAAERTVRLTFVAEEGEPTIISEVQLLWPDDAVRQAWEAQVQKLVQVQAGQRLQLSRYEQSKRDIVRFLGNQAHPMVKVQGQVRVYRWERRAVVVLRIVPGPRLLFGPVEVKGNRRLSKKFILQEKTFSLGQPYSLDAMDRTQQALLDTGFFGVVTLHPQYHKVSGGMVPVLIEVQERPPQSVQLRVGWGNEDLLRVGVQWVNRNLLGLNDTFSVEGKLSAIYEGMVGTLKIPYIPNRQANLVTRGGIEQRDSEAFVNNRLFVNPAVEYRLDKQWSWYLGYNVERDRIRELRAQVPDPGFENQTFFISSVPLGIIYDSRNSVLDATKGTYLRLEVEVASEVLGSELSFIRPVIDLRHVLPLPWQRWYLALRASGGAVYALPGTDTIPLIRRFFPGGADSVRGYPWEKLGPLDKGGNPLGGESMAVGSVELRFPLLGELGGVVFVDAGNAWSNVISQDQGTLRFTTGFGLRYNTPVGPIRLDIGYQLNPPQAGLDDRYEVYLSVGQAF
ncbi:MAG: BamA/TamA family outer membrane protein [Thermodesulfobacteriota bacterium]